MDYLNPVCLLVRGDIGDANSVFLGTCFAFRSRTRFLTAAHCLAGLEPQTLGIFSPKTGETPFVVSVETHPTADIAVLSLDQPLPHNVQPLFNSTSRQEVGDDFVAYGFPEDVFAQEHGRRVPRLFKGHFQRYFDHKSHLGFRYLAGELSVGCPAGLSGGPVFAAGDPAHRVKGVVTENLESTTVLEEVQEIEREGTVSRLSYAKIINYGLCAMLSELNDWLDIHAPAETT